MVDVYNDTPTNPHPPGNQLSRPTAVTYVCLLLLGYLLIDRPSPWFKIGIFKCHWRSVIVVMYKASVLSDSRKLLDHEARCLVVYTALSATS